MKTSISSYLVIIITLLFNFHAYSQTDFKAALDVYETQDFAKAIELFTNTINSGKDEAKSLMYRSDCYVSLGKFEEAKKDLDLSLKTDPSTKKLHYFFGRYYLFKNDPENAIKAFTEAIEHDVNDDQSYDGRALAKIQLKDFKGAIADDDLAIQLYQNDRTFYNNRGFAKSLLEQYEEALKDFNISISISPNSKAYANKGLIYAEMELFTMAIDNFSQALEINPNNPEILFYRGHCFEILNKTGEACTDYISSRNISDQIHYVFPNFENLKEALKRLNCH